VFERTHEIDYVFWALWPLQWFARAVLLAGIVKTATGNACKKCKTLGQLGQVCVKMLGHKCSFSNSHFLDSGRKK